MAQAAEEQYFLAKAAAEGANDRDGLCMANFAGNATVTPQRQNPCEALQAAMNNK